MKINKFIKSAAKECSRSKIMQSMKMTNITREQFLFYLRQESCVGSDFNKILTIAIEKAKEIGDKELTKVLSDNLNDEKGIDKYGNYNPLMVHELWKKKYYLALDILPDMIESEKPISGTIKYNNTMILLEKTENIFVILGGLMFIEFFTPIEFFNIKKSRDFLFPKIFVITEQDSHKQLQNKLVARIWIDDHIIHDAQKHYLDLLKSAFKYEKNVDVMKEISKGNTLMKEGILAFHKDVEAVYEKAKI
jgi:hypothetical protein